MKPDRSAIATWACWAGVLAGAWLAALAGPGRSVGQTVVVDGRDQALMELIRSLDGVEATASEAWTNANMAVRTDTNGVVTSHADLVLGTGESLTGAHARATSAVQPGDNIAAMEVVAPAPDTTVMVVAGFGGDVNGMLTNTSTYNERPFYGDGVSKMISWTGTNWWIFNESGGLGYFSDDDVATPNLCTTWVPGDGESPTIGTVTPGTAPAVTVGDVWQLDSAIPKTIIVSGFNVGNGTYEWTGEWYGAGTVKPVYTNNATGWSIHCPSGFWTIVDDAFNSMYMAYDAPHEHVAYPTLVTEGGWHSISGGAPEGTVVLGEAFSETVQEMKSYIDAQRHKLASLGSMAYQSSAIYALTSSVPISASFSGTTTKMLTIVRGGGGNITASFTDDNTTYSEIATTTITNAASATAGLITGRRADFLIQQKAHPIITGGYFTVINSTNLVFIAGAVTNSIDADITSP